jgi:glyoxylate/hydroxypyruvate reductase A
VRVVVYFPGEALQRWTDALAKLLPEAEVRAWSADAPPFDADYVAAFKPPPELFAREKRVRVVFNLAAGVEAVLAVPTLDPAIPIYRLEDAGMAEQMADYASYAVLRWYRDFDRYAEQAARGEWKQRKPRRKQDFRVGVLGLGEMGGAVARRIASLGFPVRGWSRTLRTIEGVATFAGPNGLMPFLADARVVIATLPLTSETRGILDRNAFAQMPAGSFVVNVGRGGLIVEQDLLNALDSGRVAGAMLDVFAAEPLPADHPFWHHPRVKVTPHVSAVTLRDVSLAQIAEKIRRCHRGETVTGRVDRGRGY